VAGVAALALSANPTLSNTQLVSALEQNADDLGPAGYDSSFGYGRVNAFRTVTAVTASSQLPTVAPAPLRVALSSPLANASYPLGTEISISATVTPGSGGDVTNVTFLVNATGLGGATAVPFTIDWNPIQTGSYSLTAIAIDESGLSATSAPIVI